MTEPLFKWPLIVIDFEASALATDAYPIEVGIAIADTPTSDPVVWSTLVSPAPSWKIDQQWDPDAERIHGITRWELRDGLTARKAMDELNQRIPNGVKVWCDGGHYDKAWLEALSQAADLAPSFELRDLSTDWRCAAQLRECFMQLLASTRAPHRADQDAARVLKALCQLHPAAGGSDRSLQDGRHPL